MSETQNIHFELVSPEQKLVSEPVAMAVIPGMEGEMGVGAGHASYVVGLKTGVVKLYEKSMTDDAPRKIFIAGGFADVTGDNCTVLAEDAVNVNDLNAADIEQEIKNLNEDLGMAAEEADKARIQKKLDLAAEKLKAVKAS